MECSETRDAAAPEILACKRVVVTGVVQGVGFRPFVYRLAKRHGLSGWVCNTSNCVEMEVAGTPASLQAFVDELQTDAPALSRLESVVAHQAEPAGREGFVILDSRNLSGARATIPADVSTCDQCFAEVTDPG